MPLRLSGSSRIQRKLLIAFLCITIIPLLSVGVYGVYFTISLLERTAVESMVSRTLLKAREIERFLIDAKSDIFFLHQTPSLRSLMEAFDRGTPDQIEFLRRKVGQQFIVFAATKHLYSEIAYIDQDGREILRVDSDGEKATLVGKEKLRNRENDRYFTRAITLSTGQVYLSGPERYYNEQSTEPTIRYAMKVFSRYGRKGVITTNLRAGYLLQIVGGTDGATLLVDREGNSIAGVRKEVDFRIDHLSDFLSASAVSQILKEGSGKIKDDPTWIISYKSIFPPRVSESSNYWVLVDLRPRNELFTPVRTYLWTLSVIVAVSFSAALLLAIFLARRFTRPLIMLRDSARWIGQGDLSRRADNLRTGDEIEDLAYEFNRMADRLSAVYAGLEERIAEKSRELERANSQLLQSEKLAAIGTLAAGIAHEINNPLHGLVNYLNRLRRHPDDIQQSQAYLDLMEEALTRITDVVRRLLDFSRRHELHLTPTDINSVVEAARSLVSYQVHRQNIVVDTNLSSELPMIFGDRHYLQQVLVNLLVNAVQAMPDGGRLTITTRHLECGMRNVECGMEEEREDREGYPQPAIYNPQPGEGVEGGEGWVEVVVQDTGRGIPEEELGKIFDPFYTTKKVGEGTGLGLSISYAIIKEHNGTIDVKSEPYVGTTFTVCLPVPTVLCES